MPYHLMQNKVIILCKGEIKDTPQKKKSVKKNDAADLFILSNFHWSNSNGYSVVYFAPACLYFCMTTSGHAPNERTDGVLGYLLPDLDQDITELLDSLT